MLLGKGVIILSDTLNHHWVLVSRIVPRLSDLSPRGAKNWGNDKEENQDHALSQRLRKWLACEG